MARVFGASPVYLVLWSVWPISLGWFNQTHETDPITVFYGGGPFQHSLRTQREREAGRRLLVMLSLGEKERGVESLLSHQIVVSTLFDDLAPVDDKDPVGHFYSRQSVAD